MSVLSSSVIIYKQPSEVIKVSMDFSQWVENDIELSNPVVSSLFYGCDTTDLVFSNVTVAGQTVEMFVSGGTDGNRYRVEITVTTNIGETLVGDGSLEVTTR